MAHLSEVSSPRLQPFSEVVARPVQWIVPGFIPSGTLTLVAGIGGLGKSTWLITQAARLSTGITTGEPADTIIVSYEDPPAEVILPRIKAAGGDPTRIHQIVFTDAEVMVSLPDHIGEITTLARERAVRLIVIDPIVAAFESRFDTYKDQDVRRVLALLARLAETERCGVAIVGHLNKTQSRDAYNRVGNSTAFWNAARSVVLITADPYRPEDLRLVSQQKANWARCRPIERHRMETFRLDSDAGSGSDDVIETARLVFVEEATDVDPDDLLAEPSREPEGRTSDAEMFIRDQLADGEWHASADVKAGGVERDLTDRTLQRASGRIPVETRREGYPARTFWRLPQSRQLDGPVAGATSEIAQPSGFEPVSTPLAPDAPDAPSEHTSGASDRAQTGHEERQAA